MKITSYKDVGMRFSKIHSDFVNCSLDYQAESCFKVELYPWWEHPKYIESVNKNQAWEFSNFSDGIKELRIDIINLVEARFAYTKEVESLHFLEDHPHIWEYEHQGDLIVNSEVNIDILIENILSKDISYINKGILHKYFNINKSVENSPYSLGIFPNTLLWIIVDELENMGISFLRPNSPSEIKKPVLLMINNSDYIIAEDFKLNVPEFEHRDEWFTP